MKRILCVAGARPNFMKIAPVLAALRARGADPMLVHTGQHYDAAMSDVFFAELEIPVPDVHLGVGSGSHAQQTAAVMVAIEPVVLEHRPDAAVVVGDVNSTVAVAMVAAKLGVPVAHVEAGLRSRDWAMPEEINRVVTDRLSSWLLAPSQDAVDNLLAEGVAQAAVHLVGNVMIDTLLQRLPAARERPIRAKLDLGDDQFGLVTLHRPSNVDDAKVLADLLETLGLLAEQLPLVFPVHPRTRPLVEQLGVPDGIHLVAPVGYLDFVNLQDAATFVVTDSGGVQEETTVLGTPCITVRETTERPITVDEGTNCVVGRDRALILAAAQDALAGRIAPRHPALWDGVAGERIASAILDTPPVDPTSVRPD